MPLLHSLILGIVEGFTEFLPISSTAHIILTAQLLGIAQSSFVKTFEIAVQSGAILAVVAVYWRRFLNIEVLKKVIAAFIPTAVIGLVLYKFIKSYLVGNMSVVLWALGIGGVILILFEKFYLNKRNVTVEGIVNDEITSLSYGKAALIGVAQAVAVIPGVSRSAATIIGGSLAGMSLSAVVQFSFLLAVPTIGAATILDLYKNMGAFTSDETGSLIIGFMAAFVTALLGIRFLRSLGKNKMFTGFGIYRIVVAVLFVILFV